MSGLKAEVDPAEVGLDAERLGRIDGTFARYVDDGRLAGYLVTVSRHGKLAHVSSYGARDREEGLPVESDTLWRIFSMTKPITSVAAMMLYEEGALQLTDPVSKFIPSFAGLRVYAGGSDQNPLTVPATEPMRVWHLLTHTSGLTYGFMMRTAVDAAYRRLKVTDRQTPGGLQGMIDQLATLPLDFGSAPELQLFLKADDGWRHFAGFQAQHHALHFFADDVLGFNGDFDAAFDIGLDHAVQIVDVV